jgi:hypothetical protein
MSSNPNKLKMVPMTIVDKMKEVLIQVIEPGHCVFPHSNY